MFYQITALLLLAAFYGIYFAKMIHQHNQGIQTNLLGKGKTGFVKFIELFLKFISYIVLAVELINIIFARSSAPSFLRIIGAVTGAAGVCVFAVSVITMRDSWRAGVPESDKTELITQGIYGYSRNPAFLGFDLVYIGILLMFFEPVLLAVTILTVLMFHLQIVNVEENYLITAFGEEYLEYKHHVRRYLGRKRNT